VKYLQKSFSVYPTVQPQTPDPKRRAKAKLPHEYENGGGICQLCGMDSKAKIHKVKA
jgi:hypothetical protein